MGERERDEHRGKCWAMMCEIEVLKSSLGLALRCITWVS